MTSAASAAELRTVIANYKRTRSTSAESMHYWLDTLIADAEARLGQLSPVEPPAPPASSAPAVAAPARRIRSTYPFDENAPWQRIPPGRQACHT